MEVNASVRAKNIKYIRNVTHNTPVFKDELEFGYIDSPHQRFPVVLDSPRDGDLQDFPYDVLLVRKVLKVLS